MCLSRQDYLSQIFKFTARILSHIEVSNSRTTRAVSGKLLWNSNKKEELFPIFTSVIMVFH
jgi:hypothetical protein